MTQAGYAPNTLRMARNPIAAALTLAVRWDIIRHNPCQQIPLPAPPKRAGIAWTTEEYRRFLAHKGAGRHPRWGIVWRFALTTGVRVGELAALAWEDVDLDAGTVTIARTVTRGADGGTVIGAFAKTSASRRVLPLDPDVIAALRPLRALPKALLFPAGDGGPLTRRTIGQALERAAAAADVPRATMHDLRRTWISRMIEAGVNPEIVATLAGHTSVVLTLDKYTRSTEQQRRDSILALRAFIADTTTSTTENPGNEASRTHGAPTTGEDAAKLA
ncbi:MAG TPA: site-specific integrase [Steroidobacteraceae bacterium]|nr:site-specific integrase [Steroidobacteraceae bacterium]